ncbi:MAG TPA: UV DNA damage repair endonuclease UvsE [Clostridia bacterium]|nr:UV DNA damage repair endonuclease UvsE [Clostridia bacterium]
MSIGYACLTVGVPETGMKTCLMKNASRHRLSQLIANNLKSLDNIMDYNIENGIQLFRISSDLIPFGSHPVNDIEWCKEFSPQFKTIGDKIKKHDMRVSMHPGQYTVLNSPDKGVVARAVEDLNYHAKVLDCLDLEKKHKIILHIGGAYGNKGKSMERFMDNYHELSNSVKDRLVIENDDRSYNIAEVLKIGLILNLPVVLDNLHHKVNPPDINKSETSWIGECRLTWSEEDGMQKVHYSQQDSERRPGAHSNSIAIGEFMDFYSKLNGDKIDIMLEVKDKNLSAIKCINCISDDSTIKVLEEEWSKYKYNILEKSPKGYTQIRNLLKDKTTYPAVEFYSVIEGAMSQPERVGYAVNALEHVWGYFKNEATPKEKERFSKQSQNYKNGQINLRVVKRFLGRLALKYDRQYLLDSYYFTL